MQSMRAKVRVYSVTPNKNEKDEVTSENLVFVFPAKDGPYPADGSDEDQQFAKYSPSGDLKLTVANPSLLGRFNEGDTFYLDFVPVTRRI
jgi:hypothetical protein